MNLLVGLLLFVSFINPVYAQDDRASVLHHKITVEAKNETVYSILKAIEKQAGTNFSYNSKIINPQKRKTVSFEQKTIAEIIDLLFDNKVSCKVKGNYIVLYKTANPPAPISDSKTKTIKKTPAESRHYLKPSTVKNDTIVRYFIDVIATNSKGKDSVIQTESILVPTSHILQIKDDSTIIMLEKDQVRPK